MNLCLNKKIQQSSQPTCFFFSHVKIYNLLNESSTDHFFEIKLIKSINNYEYTLLMNATYLKIFFHVTHFENFLIYAFVTLEKNN